MAPILPVLYHDLYHRNDMGVFTLKHIKNWIGIYGITAFLFLFSVHSGSRAVTTIVESIPPEKHWRIVIDAGHGGMDSGTTSLSGIPESKYNLEIALRAKDLFSLLGYQSILTRANEQAIHTEGETIAARKASDLRQRVRIANSDTNTIFISIHQNHFADGRYRGPQVFYAETSGSKDLAQSMQTALTSALYPENNRQIAKAKGIYLMEHIHCTGILVECGFLSNPQEDRLLKEKHYQQKISSVLACVTAQYLKNQPV